MTSELKAEENAMRIKSIIGDDDGATVEVDQVNVPSKDHGQCVMTLPPLKPCPICGQEPIYIFLPEENFGEWDTHQFRCVVENDHMVLAIDTSEDGAAAKWNTRAGETK